MQSYTIQEVETKLKDISSDFTVVENPNSDLAGIYYQGYFAEIAMSKEKVFKVKNNGYVDPYDRPHAGLDEIMLKAKSFYDRMQNDEEFRKDITEPFDINKL